ncbi:hypothetical protein [Streptococcus phage P738]|nr:hypothetical protein [Streptococcus phage P738]
MEKMTMTKSFENFKKGWDNIQKEMVKYNEALFGSNQKNVIGRDGEEYQRIKGKDNVVSPNHYVTDKGFEVFDVQEAFIHELKGMAASYWCNVVKYILRFQRKNGVEDLKKAKYYLEKLIEKEENK